MRAIAVLGTGAWGTALAMAVARTGVRVLLWGRDPARVARLAEERENQRDLPGVLLDPRIEPISEPALLAACDLWLVAVPLAALRSLLNGLAVRPQTVVLACKGIERGTLATPSRILAETMPGVAGAILSGPSFASEVAHGQPTALTVAASELARARAIATRLATPAFRLYPSDDPVGVELGGALKNVIAIAAGAVLGLGLGENARAALITRGLAEIGRLVERLGGRRETVSGLSGLGDLVLSATSLASRNTRFGYELARGRSLEELTRPGAPLAEGVWSAPAAAELAARLGLDLPITRAVAAVVGGSCSVAEAVADLLARPLPERE